MSRKAFLFLALAAGLSVALNLKAGPALAATADEALAEAQQQVTANPRDAGALRALGDVLEVKGQPTEAKAAYEKALEIEPNQVEARVGLARVLAQAGDDKAALAEQQKVADLLPNDPEAHHFLGVIALRAGQRERALAAWNSTLKIQPDHVATLNNLGALLLELRRPAEAIPVLERAVAAAPGLPTARTNLGFAYLRAGRGADAIKEYRAVLDLAPDDPDAARNLALAYMETKQPQEAISLFRQVVRMQPSPEVIRELGVALLEAQRADEAELVLKVAVAGRPDWGAAFVDLGRAQAARGDLEGAAASLTKGLELDPKDADGHLALARLQARRKEYAPAWRHAREAERLGAPGAREFLAELARRSKEPGGGEQKAAPPRPSKKAPAPQ